MRRLLDDLGAEVLVADRPARIVSLVPSLSELLAAWRLVDRVVGVTEWCVAPAGAFDGMTRVRGTKNPDLGAVRGLEPDLVLANEEENRELDVRRLREAGVPVYVTRVRTVADAATCVERLGPLLGVAAPAAELAADIRTAARAPAGGADVPTLCPIWRDPWMVVGGDTFAGDLLARAGAAVWHPRDDARYPRVDLQQARAAGVRLVLLPDEPYPFGPADRAEFDDWDAAVELVDGAMLTWWGPRTPAALTALARLVAAARAPRR